MDKEVLIIKRNALQQCWYMRGGISYTDIMNMSESERGLISEIIEENLKITKDSGMNFF